MSDDVTSIAIAIAIGFVCGIVLYVAIVVALIRAGNRAGRHSEFVAILICHQKQKITRSKTDDLLW